MKKTPYLDIYHWKTIVLKVWEKNFLDENLLDYIKFLENQNIKVVLIDKNGEKLNKLLDLNTCKTSEKIQNLLFLENEDCNLYTKNWKKIEFLSKWKLKKLLDWENNDILLDKNSILYKKLGEIYNLMEKWFDKITLTESGWLQNELEWFGSWIMFVNLEKARFKYLNNFALFKQIYNFQIEKWNWKKREDEKLQKLSKIYKVLELDGTILWWFALSDFEVQLENWFEKWKILELLFTVRWWGEISKVLVDEIKRTKKVFAYSKVKKFFQAAWFTEIPWITSSTWASLWKYENVNY